MDKEKIIELNVIKADKKDYLYKEIIKQTIKPGYTNLII